MRVMFNACIPYAYEGERNPNGKRWQLNEVLQECFQYDCHTYKQTSHCLCIARINFYLGPFSGRREMSSETVGFVVKCMFPTRHNTRAKKNYEHNECGLAERTQHRARAHRLWAMSQTHDAICAVNPADNRSATQWIPDEPLLMHCLNIYSFRFASGVQGKKLDHLNLFAPAVSTIWTGEWRLVRCMIPINCTPQ